MDTNTCRVRAPMDTQLRLLPLTLAAIGFFVLACAAPEPELDCDDEEEEEDGECVLDCDGDEREEDGACVPDCAEDEVEEDGDCVPELAADVEAACHAYLEAYTTCAWAYADANDIDREVIEPDASLCDEYEGVYDQESADLLLCYAAAYEGADCSTVEGWSEAGTAVVECGP